MSFRQRKSANNNGKMKKWLSVRKCSTHSHTLVFPPFSSLGNMPKCGQDQTNQFMALNPKFLQDLPIIMGSPEVHLVGQEDILPMGTQVEDTVTQIEQVKVVLVMAVDLILLKGGGHLTGPIVCLVAVLVAVVPAAMLELQIIPNKVVHMGAQRLVVART